MPTVPLSPEELARRQADADRLRTDPLAHDGLIRRIAAKYTLLDPAVSLDDAVSECRLALLQSLPDYRPERAAWSTWAWTVCHRLMNKIAGRSTRTVKRRRQYTGAVGRRPANPDQVAQEQEHHQALRQAVDRLPHPLALAVRLIYLQGHPPAQVLRTLRCNPRQLQAWLRDGLAQLRAQMPQEGLGDVRTRDPLPGVGNRSASDPGAV